MKTTSTKAAYETPAQRRARKSSIVEGLATLPPPTLTPSPERLIGTKGRTYETVCEIDRGERSDPSPGMHFTYHSVWTTANQTRRFWALGKVIKEQEPTKQADR